MTEQEYKQTMKELLITVGVSIVPLYTFLILGFIYDIH